jgi:hypothetical protein
MSEPKVGMITLSTVRDDTRLTCPEYDRLLRCYLEEVGPNPGTSMWGRIAWVSLNSRAFRRQLAMKGISVVGRAEPIPSAYEARGFKAWG